ncbi:MAG: peptide chain release factor [Thalassolituus oleivorans]|jgi:peptide chain release factor
MTKEYKKTMNPLKNEPEVVWLQLSAGQGPKECGWVVAQLTRTLMHDAAKHSIGAELVERLAFDKILRKQNLIEVDAFLSCLIRLEGVGAEAYSQLWEGAVKWQGASPYRGKLKRCNWFVGSERVLVSGINANGANARGDNASRVNTSEANTRGSNTSGERRKEITAIDLKVLANEVDVETMRSGGPGGQHVNKTSSAVRLTHRPTGIQVRVESDRSQHRNRQLAMERLHIILAAGEEEKGQALVRDRWLKHYQVERGNPVRVFQGLEFKEKR